MSTRIEIAPPIEWIRVPAGTKEARCNRCGHPIYWLHKDGKRFPIDCDAEVGSQIPSAPSNEASGGHVEHWEGVGVSHFLVCKTNKPRASTRTPAR